MNIRSLLKRTEPHQPIEVGRVSWLRNLEEALAEADRTGYPVFALFQEVPGCAGCKQFGADVLSNPVIVDAIESEFVPLMIRNNADGGHDAEVLARYGEPAWNFQVVRFLDADGLDVIERRDRVWETGPLATRMIEAMESTGRPAPAWFKLIEAEYSDRLQMLHLAQGCFWVGEMELGQIDGVVVTQAAFMNGHEITSVLFDPDVINPADLVQEGVRRRVASAVFAEGQIYDDLRSAGVPVEPADYRRHRVAPDRDQKRQLSSVSGLDDLTPAQLTKLNGFLPVSANAADHFLSPSQRERLRRG